MHATLCVTLKLNETLPIFFWYGDKYPHFLQRSIINIGNTAINVVAIKTMIVSVFFGSILCISLLSLPLLMLRSVSHWRQITGMQIEIRGEEFSDVIEGNQKHKQFTNRIYCTIPQQKKIFYFALFNFFYPRNNFFIIIFIHLGFIFCIFPFYLALFHYLLYAKILFTLSQSFPAK